MNSKILSGIMLLLAVVFTACSDKEDYTIYTADIITTLSTGTANASATSADVTGTVLDLSKSSSASYEVGIIWSQDSAKVTTGTKVVGELADDGTVTAHITGLETDKTYYFRTYVTLQGKNTRFSENNGHFITTNADVATADPIVGANKAELCGTTRIATDKSDEVIRGFLVSSSEEGIKEGRLYEVGYNDSINTFSAIIEGLAPRQTYYYAAYTKINGTEYYGATKSFTIAAQDVEFVDLGLSVEWATVNIGASKPSEAGGLYGYADNTLFNTSTSNDKYYNGDYQGDDYDIASMCIDGAFTPSKEEFEELINNTTATSETVDNVPGFRFTAANGNSIFLPVTGIREGTSVASLSTFGGYWSGNIDAADGNYASCLTFNMFESPKVAANSRYMGLALRAVRYPNHPINLDYLYNEWCIDIDELAKSVVFEGPIYFYGTADSWNSITNGYKISGDSWSWCPLWAENTWLCDAKNHGTMEFKKDGTVIVKDLSNAASYEGTYTVDTENKTISLNNAKILHTSNYDGRVSNWSTNLKILSLSEKGLQIAALRDLNEGTTDGPCLLSFNYAPSSLVGGNGSQTGFDNSKLKWGDLEGNGNLRVELYNEWGGTHDDPGFAKDAFTFNKNMAVTFKLSGIDGNLKDGAVGQYNAGIGFADASWGTQYWGGTPKQDALIKGDGEYTVWMTATQTSSGTMVFVIDCKGLGADIVDMSKVSAEIVSITTDQNEDKFVQYTNVDNSKILFNNKDGNGVDGRIEIYNEYGDTKANPGVDQSSLSFGGHMAINFTIEGIDGNLKDGAAADYKTELSYATPSWSPSYWGGGIGAAQVKGDGTYTVYFDLGENAAGAVVWCIEVYGLWQDLVDPTKVKVTINEIATNPAK